MLCVIDPDTNSQDLYRGGHRGTEGRTNCPRLVRRYNQSADSRLGQRPSTVRTMGTPTPSLDGQLEHSGCGRMALALPSRPGLRGCTWRGSQVASDCLPAAPASPTPIPGRPGAWRGRRRLAAGDLGALAGPPRRGWIWVVGPPALPACPAAGGCGQHSDLALGDRGEPARSGAPVEVGEHSSREVWGGCSLRAARTLLCSARQRMRGSAQVGDQT